MCEALQLKHHHRDDDCSRACAMLRFDMMNDAVFDAACNLVV